MAVRKLSYVCSECGTPIAKDARYCRHVEMRCPGWCKPVNGQRDIGRHELCPGHAIGHEEGSCPCSCHGPFAPATDEEIARVAQALLKMQEDLDA